jgi:plastocyanin domain-containing protein
MRDRGHGPLAERQRALPLNEPVVIEFTPASGDIAFACGMNMLKGVSSLSDRAQPLR